MSKFDEMCQAYSDAEKRWTQYRDRCIQNMNSIVIGFMKYSDTPQQYFALLPLDKDPEKGLKYSVPGAMHLDDDGYWHLGLQIELHTLPNALNRFPALIELCLAENAGKVMVKSGGNDAPVQLDIANERECAAFYDKIIGKIKAYFALEPGFSNAASLKKIGFAAAYEPEKLKEH